MYKSWSRAVRYNWQWKSLDLFPLIAQIGFAICETVAANNVKSP